MGVMKLLNTRRQESRRRTLGLGRHRGRFPASQPGPLNGLTTSGLPTGGRRGSGNGASPVAGGQKARSGLGSDVKQMPDGVLLPQILQG